MSTESPAATLDRFEGEAATGCLSVGGELRVYLGMVFYLADNSRG